MMAMWYTEATDLNQDFCKGSSKMNDTKPFIANKGCLWIPQIQFELSTKMSGKAVSANKEPTAILYLVKTVRSLCTLMSS